MKLFIETNSGRLQNLYLLQDVRVVDSRIQEDKCRYKGRSSFGYNEKD